MNTLNFAILAVCVGIGSLTVAAAAEPETSLPEFGTWSGDCDAWGVPATCTSTWHPGLGANHIVQDYSIISRASGDTIFAGRGLYQLDGASVFGIWEDSRGAILELSGTYEEQVLEVIWVDPQSEIGRSTYRWGAGQLDVKDSVLTENGWRVFMHVTYLAP